MERHGGWEMGRPGDGRWRGTGNGFADGEGWVIAWLTLPVGQELGLRNQ